MDRAQYSLASRKWRAATLFAAAWVFIVLVGAFDSYFAWRYRADFQEWELNPWARWLAGSCGMGILLCAKATGMVFAAAVACACRRLGHRLAMPMTMVIAGVYLMLSLHYVTSFLAAPTAVPQEIIAFAGR